MNILGTFFQFLFALALPTVASVSSGLPPAAVRVPPPPPIAYKVRPESVGIDVTAKSAVVADAASGQELFSKDADRVQPVASLTKLMTALVISEMGLSFEEEMTIEADDLRGGGVEYLLPGEVVTVRDLWFAALVASSNTATAALVRSTGVDEATFVRRMNEKAVMLGMQTAVFVEPTGLDTGNQASARDMLILARTAFAMDRIRQAVTLNEFVITPKQPKGDPRRVLKSTDQLLGTFLTREPYAIRGGKTGSLGDAVGYHLAVAVSYENAHQVFVVTLGSATPTDRFQDAKALAVWTFDTYAWDDSAPDRD